MNQRTKEEGHGSRHTGPEIGEKGVEYTKVECNHTYASDNECIVCGKHMSIVHCI